MTRVISSQRSILLLTSRSQISPPTGLSRVTNKCLISVHSVSIIHQLIVIHIRLSSMHRCYYFHVKSPGSSLRSSTPFLNFWNRGGGTGCILEDFLLSVFTPWILPPFTGRPQAMPKPPSGSIWSVSICRVPTMPFENRVSSRFKTEKMTEELKCGTPDILSRQRKSKVSCAVTLHQWMNAWLSTELNFAYISRDIIRRAHCISDISAAWTMQERKYKQTSARPYVLLYMPEVSREDLCT